jgi:CTP:molybdopterin cytidylyltransferase MocA
MLAPLDAEGTPLIRRILETWTSVPFDEVLLVVGCDADTLTRQVQGFSYAMAAVAAPDIQDPGGPAPAVKGAQSAPRSGQRPSTAGSGPIRVRLVRNPRWESGMFSSVKAGLAAVAAIGRSTHVAVSPADLPFLRRESLRRVMDAAAPLDERTVLVPTCAGRRGHPIVFSAALVPRILSWPDDRRLSHLFKEIDLRTLPLGGFDDDILRDVDRPEDLSSPFVHRPGETC